MFSVKIKKTCFIACTIASVTTSSFANKKNNSAKLGELNIDSLINKTKDLSTVEVFGDKLGNLERLKDVEETSIFAGKKTEVINLSKTNANLATNNTRQVFGKVPGISIWENDGSGIQIGIASRGLSPNRSWEFNSRQNCYDITPDIFGYPEAYFNPPLEAVEKIQVVRGASSLQYGPQFGGLLNYVIKKGNSNKPIEFETKSTISSYNTYSFYNAIGGTYKKMNYYAYYNHRNGKGWRDNNAFSIDNAYASASFALTTKLKLGTEITYMNYLIQQAGGLTDSLFNLNPQQSLRSRNWFNVPWFIPALTLDYEFDEKSKLSFKTNAVIGERNSIGYLSAINTLDTFNLALKSYNARQIDRDKYSTFGTELRYLLNYNLFNKQHTLATGFRYYNSHLVRQQQGKGDNGSNFNLNLLTASFPRDLQYTTQNVAAFAENIFRLHPKLTITPGIRLESIVSSAKGRLGLNTDATEKKIQDQESSRIIVLAGVGAEYKFIEAVSAYGNFSQAYRPVLYSDLTPPATTDVIDNNLKDANGYNVDIGIRGTLKKGLSFDISGFMLQYNDRIGTIAQLNSSNIVYQLKTNVGNSLSKGVESFLEFNPIVAFIKRDVKSSFNLFASFAYVDAKYQSFKTITSSSGSLIEGNLQGKQVEYAPKNINRFGLTYNYSGFSVTWQMSMVSDCFSDALNTEKTSANGVSGKIPGYKVMDLSAAYKFSRYSIQLGVNNLADEKYFTRRTGGYPGPGLIPADGRTFYVAFGAKI